EVRVLRATRRIHRRPAHHRGILDRQRTRQLRDGRGVFATMSLTCAAAALPSVIGRPGCDFSRLAAGASSLLGRRSRGGIWLWGGGEGSRTGSGRSIAPRHGPSGSAALVSSLDTRRLLFSMLSNPRPIRTPPEVVGALGRVRRPPCRRASGIGALADVG